MTYIFNTGGFLPETRHCLMIRGKLTDITREDVMQLAAENGIRKAEDIIREVVESLKQLRPVAEKYGVDEQWIGRVEATVVDHLKAWGEWEEKTPFAAVIINGHTVSGFQVEQQYKGNYCLQAIVDGTKRKYIIRKGTLEHETLTRTGLAKLTDEMKLDLVARFLL
jgi:serine/threonine-protein kinase HipA